MPGSRLLVASRGDEALVRFRARAGAHFPQLEGGTYAGHYPADGAAAVAHLAGADRPRRRRTWCSRDRPSGGSITTRSSASTSRSRPGSSRATPRPAPSGSSAAARHSRCRPRSSALRGRRRARQPAGVSHRSPDAAAETSSRARRLALGRDAFYNPAGYGTKTDNYASFCKGLADAGVPLLTVELAFGDTPFELAPGDAERLVQLRGGDVLWQKERLLNLGVAALPDDCDKVAWLDCDVLFARRDWAARTAKLLETYVASSRSRTASAFLPGSNTCEPAMLPFGFGQNELFYGIAWGVSTNGRGSLANYRDHGHTGFAWAARRDLLSRHGLYDTNVLGNGDTDIAHAMFGNASYWGLQKLGERGRAHLRAVGARVRRRGRRQRRPRRRCRQPPVARRARASPLRPPARRPRRVRPRPGPHRRRSQRALSLVAARRAPPRVVG